MEIEFKALLCFYTFEEQNCEDTGIIPILSCGCNYVHSFLSPTVGYPIEVCDSISIAFLVLDLSLGVHVYVPVHDTWPVICRY